MTGAADQVVAVAVAGLIGIPASPGGLALFGAPPVAALCDTVLRSSPALRLAAAGPTRRASTRSFSCDPRQSRKASAGTPSTREPSRCRSCDPRWPVSASAAFTSTLVYPDEGSSIDRLVATGPLATLRSWS